LGKQQRPKGERGFAGVDEQSRAGIGREKKNTPSRAERPRGYRKDEPKNGGLKNDGTNWGRTKNCRCQTSKRTKARLRTPKERRARRGPQRGPRTTIRSEPLHDT